MRQLAIIVVALLAACGGGGTTKNDASAVDGHSGVDAPPPMIDANPNACAAPGAAGNEMGVGKYCTSGGGECNGLAALFCTADFGQTPTFCTKPCGSAADCGSNSTCTSGNPDGGGSMGCVPNCLVMP
jgi:hypothetical protein